MFRVLNDSTREYSLSFLVSSYTHLYFFHSLLPRPPRHFDDDGNKPAPEQTFTAEDLEK